MIKTASDNEAILVNNERISLICSRIAGARNKEQLQEILFTGMKTVLPFNDFKVSLLNSGYTCHSPFIYQYEDRRANHPDFEELVKMEHPVTPALKKFLSRGDILIQSVEEMLTRDDVPSYAPFYKETGINEVIVYPMVTARDVISILILTNEKPGGFTAQHLQILQIIASILGVTVANILSNEEIAQREKEKSLLLKFSNDLALVQDKNEFAATISKGLKDMFQVEEFLLAKTNDDGKTGSFYILDREARYFNHPQFQKIKNIPVNVKSGIAGVVFRAGVPVAFDFLHLPPEVEITEEAVNFWVAVGLRNMLGVPLRIADKNVGILWLQPYIKKNENLINAVAAQIAMAVSNTIADETIKEQLQKISRYKKQLEHEKKYLQDEIKVTYNYSEIVGASPVMKDVFTLVAKVAPSLSGVLLLGETGTGKELIARAIHIASHRKDQMMVKVNCATLPANLIESELFGHERGSFTGASDKRIGKFELANHGTLFLDEIGEMPLELQVKLLRAIQEKEIERIGGRSVIKTDVRIIAATNKDLKKEVQEGRFRSDLYFRLNVFPITLPPLRSRRDDIPLLAQHFVDKYATNAKKGKVHFSSAAMKQLIAYDWPGNVREMEHLIERCLLLADGLVINELPLPVIMEQVSSISETGSAVKTIDQIEREHILSVLRLSNGKIAGAGGAAEKLNIPSSTLNSKMRRLNIIKGYHEDLGK